MNTLCIDELSTICNFLEYSEIKALGNVSTLFKCDIEKVEQINTRMLIKTLDEHTDDYKLSGDRFIELTEMVFRRIINSSFRMKMAQHVSVYTFIFNHVHENNLIRDSRSALDFYHLIKKYESLSNNERGTSALNLFKGTLAVTNLAL